MRHRVVFSNCLFDIAQRFIWIRIGPTCVTSCQQFARWCSDINSLEYSFSRYREHLGDQTVFPVLSVGVLSVFHIVCGDGDQVLANVLGDVGSSPDKLSGFCAVLSAMPAGVTKIKPHQNWLVLLLSINDTVKNPCSPIQTLKNQIAWLERRIRLDLRKSLPIQVCRNGVLAEYGGENGTDHKTVSLPINSIDDARTLAGFGKVCE